MAVTGVNTLHPFLTRLFTGRGDDALDLLDAAADPAALVPMIRLAALQPDRPPMSYHRVRNAWVNAGRPALKPNETARRVVLLSDTTAAGLTPLLELFAAALGVRADVEVSPYDSVEQVALDPASPPAIGAGDIVVLMLGEHWLRRRLGRGALIEREALENTKQAIAALVAALKGRGPAQLLLATVPGTAYATPGGAVVMDDRIGLTRAIAHLNDWLGTLTDATTGLIDLADAVHGAGGRAAAGRISYLRARAALEPPGIVATAREIAVCVAAACGKGHRAIAVDFDNTLWGGEVGEVGAHSIVCGLDGAAALGYRHIQQYLHGLRQLGVVLVGVSKNDPAIVRVFDENRDLAIGADDFAAIEVGWRPKSESIARVSEALGFGAEFMAFVDDSLFELAQVIAAHPFIDVLHAKPDPEATLALLSASRFGHAVTLSQTDLDRDRQMRALRDQRAARSSFASLDDFLRQIDIRLDVAPLNDANASRVVQMFARSNQFNLTTRRHQETDLRRLLDAGATIGVVSYEDAFGPQGVVSVVVLVPSNDCVEIESWVMSCRVLNRTVEQAVFAWVRQQAAGRAIVGRYLPTQKNGLVRDLYERLCFERDGEAWVHRANGQAAPAHFVTLRSAT